MSNLLAASKPHDLGNGTIITSVGQLNNTDLAAYNFARVLSIFIGVLTIIVFIYFFFSLLTGAIKIITSGENKDSFESGKKKITTGVIGVVIAIFILLFVDLLGDLFGAGNRFLDIESMVAIFQAELQ